MIVTYFMMTKICDKDNKFIEFDALSTICRNFVYLSRW